MKETPTASSARCRAARPPCWSSRFCDDDQWRPLTEKSGRETQNRINQTLRLDYDTFINASFFLQGKADEFTQKKASERKAVLGNILGLEIWETYKERTTRTPQGDRTRGG